MKKGKKIKYKIRQQLFLFLVARLLSRGMQHSYSSEILILADVRVYHRQIWAFQKQVSFLLQNQNGKIKRRRRWDNYANIKILLLPLSRVNPHTARGLEVTVQRSHLHIPESKRTARWSIHVIRAGRGKGIMMERS